MLAITPRVPCHACTDTWGYPEVSYSVQHHRILKAAQRGQVFVSETGSVIDGIPVSSDEDRALAELTITDWLAANEVGRMELTTLGGGRLTAWDSEHRGSNPAYSG